MIRLLWGRKRGTGVVHGWMDIWDEENGAHTHTHTHFQLLQQGDGGGGFQNNVGEESACVFF